jgi:hypothetical protein
MKEENILKLYIHKLNAFSMYVLNHIGITNIHKIFKHSLLFVYFLLS